MYGVLNVQRAPGRVEYLQAKGASDELDLVYAPTVQELLILLVVTLVCLMGLYLFIHLVYLVLCLYTCIPSQPALINAAELNF